jgi:hypothetical protein
MKRPVCILPVLSPESKTISHCDCSLYCLTPHQLFFCPKDCGILLPPLAMRSYYDHVKTCSQVDQTLYPPFIVYKALAPHQKKLSDNNETGSNVWFGSLNTEQKR